MTFGLGIDGFTIKRESDIIADLEDGFRAEFGEINVDAASVFGQIIGVTSKPLAELWELMDLIYLSQYPSSAEGISLDGVVQLTGVERLGPTKTTVIGLLIGDQGTSVLTGNAASVSATEETFFTTEDVIIDKDNVLRSRITVDTVLDLQLYTVQIDGSPYTFTSDADATAEEIVGGLRSDINASQSKVTASVSGDILTIVVDDLITPFTIDVDGNLSLDEIATPAPMEAQNTGPILAVVGSLDKIETPIAGWDAVDNIKDGDVGNATETDTALRIRRELSLRVLGAATESAITARLLQEVENVTAVNVIENDTQSYNTAVIVTVDEVADTFDYTVWINGLEYTYTSDGSATQGEITAGLTALIDASILAISAVDNMDGTLDIIPDAPGIIFSVSTAEKLSLFGAVPPHSFESVVDGGEDQDVANKIWGVKAAGIGTSGNLSKTVEDSEGDEHIVKFSRPIPKYAWVDVELILNPEEDFPADGLDQVQANIQALGFTLGIGDDFIRQKFFTPIYDVPGIADADLKIAVTDTIFGPAFPGYPNISIADDEVLNFDDILKITVALAP